MGEGGGGGGGNVFISEGFLLGLQGGSILITKNALSGHVFFFFPCKNLKIKCCEHDNRKLFLNFLYRGM